MALPTVGFVGRGTATTNAKCMTDRTDKHLTELEDANAKLRASLEQCRELVADYRKRLTANSDDIDDSGESDATSASL